MALRIVKTRNALLDCEEEEGMMCLKMSTIGQKEKLF